MATTPNSALSIEYCLKWLNDCVAAGYYPLPIIWRSNERAKIGKIPTGKGWSKFTMEEAIANFQGACQRETSLNVAIMTGVRSGIVVIDCDLIKPSKDSAYPQFSGVEYWQQYIQPRLTEAGIKPLVIRTGSGGYHYWFKWSPALEHLKAFSGVDMVVEGDMRSVQLDFKTNGGYVVTAPSVHASGGTYQMVEFNPVPEMPTWLIEFLTKNTGVAPPKAPTPGVIPRATQQGQLEMWALNKAAAKAAKAAADPQTACQKILDLLTLIQDRSHNHDDCRDIIWAVTRELGPDLAVESRDLVHWFAGLSNKYTREWVDDIIADTYTRKTGYEINHLRALLAKYNPEGSTLWEAKYPFVPAAKPAASAEKFVPLAGAEPVPWTRTATPGAGTTKTAKTEEPQLDEPEIAKMLSQVELQNELRQLALVGGAWNCWDNTVLLWLEPSPKVAATYIANI